MDETTTVKRLCATAEVFHCFAGGVHPRIDLSNGGGHARAVDGQDAPVFVVDLSTLSAETTDQVRAMHLLEVLAYGFSYVASECVRGRISFDANVETQLNAARLGSHL